MEYEPLPICGKLWNIPQTAERLGLAPKTLRNWIFEGRLSFFKIGGSVRISEKVVLELLARGYRRGDI
jgi:excisionase family DNA binding protein